jgi:MerR family transcriptional regulator, copper efflux regulator
MSNHPAKHLPKQVSTQVPNQVSEQVPKPAITQVTIGEAARLTGLSAKMIRHYEASGLLPKTSRSESGYRWYNERQLELLGLIRQARKLGFSLVQIQSLLSLWQNPDRSSREVKMLAEHHLAEIDDRISELSQMRQQLKQLADCCNGDDNAQCAILDGLAAAGAVAGQR